MSESLPLVLVVLGTDHHRFDRLVDWVDSWLEQQTAGSVECLVQYGTSHPPRNAEGVDFLDHAELQRLMARARVVVCHGGPSSITESRRHGHRPLVVPRSAAHHEHVDDHQQRFSRWIAAKALVDLVESEADLRDRLTSALSSSPPAQEAFPAEQDHVSQTAHRFAGLVDKMLEDR